MLFLGTACARSFGLLRQNHSGKKAPLVTATTSTNARPRATAAACGQCRVDYAGQPREEQHIENSGICQRCAYL